MSVRILSQFIEMAVEELSQKTPHWYAAYKARIERAAQLVGEGKVSRIDDHLFRVGSQGTSARAYEVNCGEKTCQCPDYRNHTREQPGVPFTCKHRIAVWLFTRSLEYQQQFDSEWQRYMIESCGGKPRPLEHQITVEEARRVLSIHRTNARSGIEGAERWYWDIPEVAAEVAECQRVIYLDQRRKEEQARQQAEPKPVPAQEETVAHEPCQSYLFPGGEDLPLFSGTPVRAQEQVFDPQPVSQQLGFFECPACRDTGRVQLTNGHVKTCWCQTHRDSQAQAASDPDSWYYFEVADETAE